MMFFIYFLYLIPYLTVYHSFCSYIADFRSAVFDPRSCKFTSVYLHWNTDVNYWCIVAVFQHFSKHFQWYAISGGNLLFMDSWCVFQVSKPSQEAYQNELNIESVERSFILSARSALILGTRQLRDIFHILTYKYLELVVFAGAEGFWRSLCLQLGYRERRVAGGHCQGHRRLHKEENNLHIKSQSGGGKNYKSFWVYVKCFENDFTLYASMLTLRLSNIRLRVSLTAGPR